MKLIERDYYLGLSDFPEIGPVRFKLLFDYFGSAKKIWEASDMEFAKINLNKSIISKFIEFRSIFSFAKILATLKRENINFLTLGDTNYPDNLKQIPDAPIVLYLRGDVRLLGEKKINIAVVGTRMMTVYGKNSCQKIVKGLVENKVSIISGLALGIDTVAHQTAIDCGGITLAVLGCGIDVVYPSSNYQLYWQIINKKGLVISEYPPGFKPTKSTFPLRNRIISGLSQGVVVIEGKKTSGALITAKYAAEQGREVFAVPGPINSPNSEGTAYLIKNGAAIIASADDIWEELI